jgi:hypothetical protein
MRRDRRTILAWLCVVAAATAVAQVEPPSAERSAVVFVCEHGSVKSLIAASLFNQAAAARSLPFRAMARGVIPDQAVPGPIVEALGRDGFDVHDFKPLKVSSTEVAAASRVVGISLDDGLAARIGRDGVERWNDVPAASVDYPAAREALRLHVSRLLNELAKP